MNSNYEQSLKNIENELNGTKDNIKSLFKKVNKYNEREQENINIGL
jgi:hypothetical protein